jgi:hypothetical protein
MFVPLMGMGYNRCSHTRWIGQRIMVRQAPVLGTTGVCRVIRLLLLGSAGYLLSISQSVYFINRKYPTITNALHWLGNAGSNHVTYMTITYP